MKKYNSWQNYFSIINLGEVDSTNNEAKRLISNNTPNNHIIVTATKQTEGRGRYGKKWDSIKGNLFMSIILPCLAPLDTMSQLSFVTSLAIERAITELSKRRNITCNIELKWPNDVLLNNKKVSGILLETAGQNNEYIIVGIGVNIKDSPNIVDYNTTSLTKENICNIDSIEMLNLIMVYFDKYYQLWVNKDFLSLRERWLKSAKDLKKQITVNTGKSKKVGIFLDVDFSGAIRLKLDNGEIKKIHTGEVFFCA